MHVLLKLKLPACIFLDYQNNTHYNLDEIDPEKSNSKTSCWEQHLS